MHRIEDSWFQVRRSYGIQGGKSRSEGGWVVKSTLFDHRWAAMLRAQIPRSTPLQDFFPPTLWSSYA